MDHVPSDPQPAPDAVDQVFAVEPVWMIVARVVDVRPFGGGSAETRRGLRLFTAGAKVYVVGGYPGMDLDTMTVVGRHRRTKKYVTVDVRSRHLIDWRVTLVYSPHVIRLALYGPSNGDFLPVEPEERHRTLESLALRFNDRDVQARLIGGPCDDERLSVGPGRPPGQLLRPDRAHPVHAVRYLLRSWDAETAVYDHAPSGKP